MSIEAKANFLNDMEKALSTEVTAHDMSCVLRVTSDVIQRYDITQIADTEQLPDDLLDCYVEALKIQGRSLKTIARYKYVIGKMMSGIKVKTRQVTVYHLRSWLASEKQRGISDRTLEGYREVFSAYFGWLHRESLIEKSPVVNLGVIKCQKKKKKIYTEVDIERLNQNCTNVRDRAILAVLESTGARISEIVGLNRDAINLQTLECTVLGKGNKERKVYLDPVAGMLIEEYFKARKDNCEALFANKSGKRLQPGGIRCMLKKLAQRACVDHVHPHKFRRTLATNLNRRGMPIQEVAAILGHEKLDTTMQYVVLNDDDLKSSYKKYK